MLDRSLERFCSRTGTKDLAAFLRPRTMRCAISLGGFLVMMYGMQKVRVCQMSMVSGVLGTALGLMPGGFLMVMSSVLVMMSGLLVVMHMTHG